MKITHIKACSNLECPNKASEGTMAVVTLTTREDRPRNVVLIVCAACADYMREAKADALKVGPLPREPMKYPKLETPPKYYRFIGGPYADQWRHVGNGVREVVLHEDFNIEKSSHYYRAIYLSNSGSGISIEAFVHASEFCFIGCKWRRV